MANMMDTKVFHANNLPTQARIIAKRAWLSNESREKILSRYQGFFRSLVEREFDLAEQYEAGQ